jgi:hypothetical protein
MKLSYGDLFDSLGDATKLAPHKSIREETVEGIKLSAVETKLIDSLCKLLHEKPELKPQKEDYYSGNKGVLVVPYGRYKHYFPTLAFTIYELTQRV